jgi:hypothetical protein
MSEEASMHIGGEGYDRFREGVAAGHEAGRSHEVMYALGFAAGFLWGALFDKRHTEPERRRAVQEA